MKILRSTTLTQGKKDNDFNFCDKDEIVYLGFICASAEVCDCERSLSGLDSRKATTSFIVSNEEITKEEFTNLVNKSETEAGFDEVDNDEINEFFKKINKYKEGDVLGINYGELYRRIY